MKRLPIGSLAPGQVLAQRVRLEGNSLFREGHRLAPRDIAYLKTKGVRSVVVRDDDPSLREPMVSRETHEHLVDEVKQIYLDYENLNPKTLKVIRTLADELVSSVLEADSLRLGIHDLRQYDEYTFRHSVNVTAISVAIGRILRMSASRLRYLATSTLVHDIGKMQISKELLKKQGPLTTLETSLLQKHPEFGLKILSERVGGSPLEWATVYQHHENMDGTGYPEGKVGMKIHEFARIASVADKYDALRSDRPYKKGWSPHQVMEFLLGPAMKSRLDPEALDALDRIVLRFPMGARIQLSEGSWGTITDNDGLNRRRPMVRLEEDSERFGPKGTEVDLIAFEDVMILDLVGDESPAAGP